MADDVSVPSPPHPDAQWVNSPVLFITGPFAGKWVRTELVVQQQPKRGRKGAIHDLRPVHPPPTVRLRLFEVLHPTPPPASHLSNPSLQYEYDPPPPPNGAPERIIPIEPRLTTHFLCFASLFKVHPPSREQEYSRVDKKVVANTTSTSTPTSASTSLQYNPLPATTTPADVVERPKSDRNRAWKAIRPHPMTAISCHDQHWPTALETARLLYQRDGKPTPSRIETQGLNDIITGIERIEGDLSFQEMSVLEPYLPREPPKWVFPYKDVTACLSKRETAGHLIQAYGGSETALYFVFSDLAIRTEGYFSLRFHATNLDWQVDHRFTRGGTGIFAPLADCVTDTFAVYSTKEFPGLPPTTDFTSYLVQHGVRIRFRDDRAVDAAVGEGRARGKGKKKSARAKGDDQAPERDGDEQEDSGASTTSAVPGNANTQVLKSEGDQWSPRMLERANEVADDVWRRRSIAAMSSGGFEAAMAAHESRMPSSSNTIVHHDVPSTSGLYQPPPSHLIPPNYSPSESNFGQQPMTASSPTHSAYPIPPSPRSTGSGYHSGPQGSQYSPFPHWTSPPMHPYPMHPNVDTSPTGHAWVERDHPIRSPPMTIPTSSPAHTSPTRERLPRRYFPYPHSTGTTHTLDNSSPHQEHSPFTSPLQASLPHHSEPSSSYNRAPLPEFLRDYRSSESHIRGTRNSEQEQ